MVYFWKTLFGIFKVEFQVDLLDGRLSWSRASSGAQSIRFFGRCPRESGQLRVLGEEVERRKRKLMVHYVGSLTCTETTDLGVGLLSGLTKRKRQCQMCYPVWVKTMLHNRSKHMD